MSSSPVAVDEVELGNLFARIKETYESSEGKGTLKFLLPLLSVDGEAMTLTDRPFFEPMFDLNLPPFSVWKTARQLGKTQQVAASINIRSAAHPHLRTLYISPRQEQTYRFSNQALRPQIRNGAFAELGLTEEGVDNVTHKVFRNGSTIHLSYAFLDCERVRGIAADMLFIDEVQDIATEFLPVIGETLSAGIGIRTFTGTAKTLNNTIQSLWNDSTQAHWSIPCYACGYWNLAAVEVDLLKMIGVKGLVCAKCDRPLESRLGSWYHTRPKPGRMIGHHIPQPITPLHYEDANRWSLLLKKREGFMNFTKQRFWNEVLGESIDEGHKLVTMTDLRRVGRLGPNDLEKAAIRLRRFPVKTLGIDWGGHGESGTSMTAIAAAGLDPVTGRVEVHYVEKLDLGYSYDDEVRRILYVCKVLGINFIGHDFAGSGRIQEVLLLQVAPEMQQRVYGLSYVRAPNRALIFYAPPIGNDLRGHWEIDKARSLVLQASCIKADAILLPDYETTVGMSGERWLDDFLNMVEDKRDVAPGHDIYVIVRVPNMPDDIAHACNYAALVLWHRSGSVPDLASMYSLRSRATEAVLVPPAREVRR